MAIRSKAAASKTQQVKAIIESMSPAELGEFILAGLDALRAAAAKDLLAWPYRREGAAVPEWARRSSFEEAIDTVSRLAVTSSDTIVGIAADRTRPVLDAHGKRRRRPNVAFARKYKQLKAAGVRKDKTIAAKMGYTGERGYKRFADQKSRCRKAGLL